MYYHCLNYTGFKVNRDDYQAGCNSSLANFEKQPIGESVKIELRPLLTKIDAKFSFSAIKIKISTL